DEAHLQNLVERLRRSGVESIAVSLLYSFANPAHENLISSALDPLGVPVSLSSRILPEYREYERTSTTVINAYLAPLMSRYLLRLQDALGRLREEGDSPPFPGGVARNPGVVESVRFTGIHKHASRRSQPPRRFAPARLAKAGS